MITAMQAAKYLCEKSDWSFTNLETQKLLYISSMFYAGEQKEKLIEEYFEAWNYGPVIPSLYHELKIFGNRPVKNIFRSFRDISNTDEYKNETEVIDRVSKAYRRNRETNLVTLTHNEKGAWAKCYMQRKDSAIPHEALQQEYKDTVNV